MNFMPVLLAVILGIGYGLGVIFFDRYVVSASTRYIALLALPLVVVCGIITSIPVELMVFEQPIREEMLKERVAEKDASIRELEHQINESRGKLQDLQKELISEAEGVGGSGVSGAGAVYREKLKIYEDYRGQTEQRIAQLSIEIDRIKSARDALSINRNEDFLSRLEALQRIQTTSPPALRTVWMLRLMLIITLAMPVLLLLLEADSEYSVMVKKRQAHSEEYKREAASDINSRIPVPNFGQGFASAIDWTGLLAPTAEELRSGHETPDEADAAALSGDWKAVGKDLRKVLNKHGAKSI